MFQGGVQDTKPLLQAIADDRTRRAMARVRKRCPERETAPARQCDGAAWYPQELWQVLNTQITRWPPADRQASIRAKQPSTLR